MTRRSAPLRPLPNVLKMEADVDYYAWGGTYLCLFVIAILVVCGLSELLGY
jgi:hypothetical protein